MKKQLILLAICVLPLSILAEGPGQLRDGFKCEPITYQSGTSYNITCNSSCTSNCFQRVSGYYVAPGYCKSSVPTDKCAQKKQSVHWLVYSPPCQGQGSGCSCTDILGSPSTLTFDLPVCDAPGQGS